MSKVSIIMPVFNLKSHVKLFNEAIDGIFGQTYKDLELIVVCDGLDKKTISIASTSLSRYKDSRARIFKTKIQYFPSLLRNAAVEISQGEFVSFHDSDDFSTPERIATLVDFLKKNDGYGVVASNIKIRTYNDSGEISNRIKGYTGLCLDRLINKKRVSPPIINASALYRKEYFKKMGGFERPRFSTDATFVSKIGYYEELYNKRGIPVINEPLYVWNRHPLSITTKRANENVLRICQKRMRKPLTRSFRTKYMAGSIDLADEEAIMASIGLVNNFVELPVLYELFDFSPEQEAYLKKHEKEQAKIDAALAKKKVELARLEETAENLKKMIRETGQMVYDFVARVT